jgi:hypothetical protein
VSRLRAVQASLIRRLEGRSLPGTGVPGLSARWFNAWSGEIDDALAALPEQPRLPHELFRRLMKAPEEPRAVVVVYRGGQPLGVLGLRPETETYWVTAMSGWLDVGVPAVARPEDLTDCFLAASADVRRVYIAGTAARRRGVQRLKQMADYLLRFEDAEAYWHESGHWRTVRKARNRASNMKLVVDGPGASEWVMRNWARKWGRREWESDFATAIAYFQGVGRWRTFTFEDEGKRRAGAMCLVDDGVLLGCSLYRDPGVEMTRMFDLMVQWGQENGYSAHSWGAGELDSYKRDWAPPTPNLVEMDFAPWPIRLAAGIKGPRALLRRSDTRRRTKAEMIADVTPAEQN